jgi:nitrite reductase/ring-hydroxylating ferredoxin subunit
MRVTICSLEELPENAGRGFTADTHQAVFVTRRGHTVYAYRNVCPHKGTSLDWNPDHFLDESGTFIQCATHGALFVVEDGSCVAGPCVGASLKSVPITLTPDGTVEIDL